MSTAQRGLWPTLRPGVGGAEGHDGSGPSVPRQLLGISRAQKASFTRYGRSFRARIKGPVGRGSEGPPYEKTACCAGSLRSRNLVLIRRAGEARARTAGATETRYGRRPCAGRRSSRNGLGLFLLGRRGRGGGRSARPAGRRTLRGGTSSNLPDDEGVRRTGELRGGRSDAGAFARRIVAEQGGTRAYASGTSRRARKDVAAARGGLLQ